MDVRDSAAGDQFIEKLVRVMIYAFPAMMVALLIGAVVVAVAYPELYTPEDLDDVGVRVTGVIVGYVEDSEQGEAVYAPVVEFTTADGVPMTWPSEIYSNPPRYRPGETVTILYDPEEPDRARIIAK